MANSGGIPDEVLASLSDEDLSHIASSKSSDDALAKLSDEGLSKIASYKPKAAPEGPSLAHDVGVKTTEGLLFGARPFVAGVGSGLGALLAGSPESVAMNPKTGQPLESNQPGILSRAGSAFTQGRNDARAEEADVSQRRPLMSAGIGIGTALATAPLLAAKGLQATAGATGLKALFQGGKSAAQIGAGLGAAQALGHADSLGEAAGDVALGAGTGFGVQTGANALSMAAPAVMGAVKNGATKVASALTGINENEIKTYANRANEVTALMKKAGGDVSVAADSIREQTMKEIQVARQKLGNQIGDALAAPQYQGVSVDGTPILSKLQDALAKSTKTSMAFRPGEISELQNVIDTTKKFIGSDGQISVQDLAGVKEELQKIAKSSYMNGAAIFPKGELAANASKGAAAEAKRLLDVAVPEVKAANSQLSRLHAIESQMNKNLIKAGKPEAALIAAGSGANPRSARLLGAIDSITGGSAQQQAENLAAGRTFGNTALLPVDFTGKAVARMLMPMAAGSALGSPVLGLAGTALTSPATLKTALRAGQFGKNIANFLPPGPGRAAIAEGLIKEVSGEERHAQTALERRMQELKNRGKNSSASGQ